MSINKRPEITEELIDFIRQFIAMNPDKSRTRLSVMLCEIWDWRDKTGRTKDMSCKLRELQPLRVEVAASKESMAQFKSLIDQYHYLKYDRCISESMAYMIYSTSEPSIQGEIPGFPGTVV
jgi:hypothetical protein